MLEKLLLVTLEEFSVCAFGGHSIWMDPYIGVVFSKAL